jgi:hypothetical protein
MIILREVIKLNPWTKNDGSAFLNFEGISKTSILLPYFEKHIYCSLADIYLITNSLPNILAHCGTSNS